MGTEHTPAPWIAARMVGEDGEPFTPEQVVEYVKNTISKSAEESGSTDFLIVYCEKEDGPADICHVGNGPTSPANAALIEQAPVMASRIASLEAERDEARECALESAGIMRRARDRADAATAENQRLRRAIAALPWGQYEDDDRLRLGGSLHATPELTALRAALAAETGVCETCTGGGWVFDPLGSDKLPCPDCSPALAAEPPAFSADGDSITCHKAGTYEINPKPPEEPARIGLVGRPAVHTSTEPYCEECGGSGGVAFPKAIYGPCPRCSKPEDPDHA